MGENSTTGWAGLTASSPYGADNADLNQAQSYSDMMAGGGVTAPSMENMLQPQPTQSQNGFTQAGPNGYPMFSSNVAGQYSPSGYANGNPIDATPSVIANQGRGVMPTGAPPMNPSMPAQPNQNPWNIRGSSTSGPLDYPQGQNAPPPKISVL